MEDTPLKAPFKQLLSEFLDPIIPDTVALGVLRAASDERTRVQELAPLIHSDPTYQQYLFAQTFLSERMSEWVVENEGKFNRDLILLERVLGLLGKAPVRNLIACAQIDRIQGTLPALGPEDKVVVTPAQLIPFALEAERTCQDNSWLSPEAAFSAGLHYDWLAAVIKKRNGSPDEKTALTAAFKEGIATAKASYELGQRVKEIELGGFLFSAGLLSPIGKALMACLFPKSAGDRSWAEFAKFCDKTGDFALDFYQLLERKRFPATHAELGSLFVNFGTLLGNLEKVLYFYPDPERLKKVGRGQYQLAALLSIAARTARSGEKKPRLETYQFSWMRANGIDDGVLKTATAAALKAK